MFEIISDGSVLFDETLGNGAGQDVEQQIFPFVDRQSSPIFQPLTRPRSACMRSTSKEATEPTLQPAAPQLPLPLQRPADLGLTVNYLMI